MSGIGYLYQIFGMKDVIKPLLDHNENIIKLSTYLFESIPDSLKAHQ